MLPTVTYLLKVALTVVEELRVTVQEPVPDQPPPLVVAPAVKSTWFVITVTAEEKRPVRTY